MSNRSRSWGKMRSERPRGLRGRDIGMYYRNQAIKAGKQKAKKDLVITLTIPSIVVTSMQTNIKSILKIAKDDNVHLSPFKELNLSDIKDTDKNTIIPDTGPFKTPECIPIKKEIEEFDKPSSSEFIPIKKEIVEFDKPSSSEFIPIKKEIEEFNKPSTSVFVPIKKENDESNSQMPSTSKMETYIEPHAPMETDSVDSKSGERLLSLRGAGDYKYGYEDIITGTFDEKLEESISKGISINMKNAEINNLSVALHEDYKEMVKRDKYTKMKKFRDTLPTFKKSEELLDVIHNNQVVVISGETGCGKSTQVPQIILDDAIINNRGANVQILVTQPRRIAASSLAMRVAAERAEKMGSSVGYAVRLEKVEARPRGSIMFCTTGILIAELEVNQGLTSYSHVILDEVHERDCHIDLSMCMLKQVLKRRKDLKLILMSATLDAEKLTAYFDNCPMLQIEGLAYPVKDVYLEDVLQMTKFMLPAGAPKGRNEKPWHKHTKKGKKNAATEMEKDILHKAEIAPWLESIKRNLDRDVYITLQDARIEDLNVDLICCLLTHICQGEPGAILVFLPGIGDITKLLRIMNESNAFPSSRYEIYPLHSKLPSLEQHKIFEKPPGHIRKIIIATNIAETSITIDDIVYVVDCGKIKYSGLNVEENISTLKTEWVSQANLRQRRGRAGRCQPGICYHLVTSFRAGKLEERLLPEIQRSNLLEPLLAVKRLRLGKAAEALKQMVSPPADSTVEWAVKHLQQCGALDESEVLTPLGWHLARLPVHPAAGKLLLLGALFGCLDRAASVAAVWGFKDPFMMVIGKEDEVDQTKRYLSLGEPSDHIAMSEAIIQWERCSSHSQKRNYAYEHFLSNNNLELLSDMKKQFGDNLRQMGFLSSGDVTSKWENRNSRNLSLFRAIVAASLYPNIATVRWTNSRNPRKLPRVKARTPEDGHVDLHPSSVMCTKAGKSRGGAVGPACVCRGANWLVYWLKQRSTNLFLIDVTLVYTLPLLFFGELKVIEAQDQRNDANCIVSISSIKVSCNKATMQLLFKMRSLLDQVLAAKITVYSRHGTQHSHFEEQVLNAVMELISAEDQCEGGYDDSESDHSEYESDRSWYY